MLRRSGLFVHQLKHLSAILKHYYQSVVADFESKRQSLDDVTLQARFLEFVKSNSSALLEMTKAAAERDSGSPGEPLIDKKIDELEPVFVDPFVGDKVNLEAFLTKLADPKFDHAGFLFSNIGYQFLFFLYSGPFFLHQCSISVDHDDLEHVITKGPRVDEKFFLAINATTAGVCRRYRESSAATEICKELCRLSADPQLRMQSFDPACQYIIRTGQRSEWFAGLALSKKASTQISHAVFASYRPETERLLASLPSVGNATNGASQERELRWLRELVKGQSDHLVRSCEYRHSESVSENYRRIDRQIKLNKLQMKKNPSNPLPHMENGSRGSDPKPSQSQPPAAAAPAVTTLKPAAPLGPSAGAAVSPELTLFYDDQLNLTIMSTSITSTSADAKMVRVLLGMDICS